MVDQDQFLEAITTLESQREALGDDVVDVTILALQEQLARQADVPVAEESRLTAQRKQVTILFANVTGFSGLAESIPDTSMLDVMNVLWHRLDGAITNQGGIIDKHMGDGVMGIFGVPTARENDPERAIRAALAMRAALSDFLGDMKSMQKAGQWPQLSSDEEDPLSNLQLNIGINTGLAMLGDVGTGDEYTVIGDTVNVASRLERAATSGGILISHDTYIQVRGTFNVEPLGPVTLKGRSESIPVYLVLGVKPRLFYASGRGVEGIETQMVGRDNELKQLEEVLKTAVQQKIGRVVTVIGEAGVGKSRLLHEFNNWLRTLSREFPSFKGRTYERTQDVPYGLFRDLFTTKFNIQENDPAASVEDKLTQGLRRYIDGDTAEIEKRVTYIGQLLGLETVSDGSTAVSLEAHQVRERAYQYIVEIFEKITEDYPVTLLFLEDIHWADDGSLELVDYLSQLCDKRPFVIITLTRPSLFNRKTTSILTAVNGHRSQSRQLPLRLELKTLTHDDSLKLVENILHKIPDIPDDLSDLIVNRSEGNPFYLEELIKVLIEDGVIVTGQEQWQVHLNQLKEVRIPPNITGVLQARLDRLSGIERRTLQRASIMGRLFWDTAVIYMNQMADEPISAVDTMSALSALEKRELIFPRQSSMLAGAQTYIFKHALLQQVTYESVLLRIRPDYHKQVADWFVEISGERLAEFASQIANHYELAGERQNAAELYEVAATRAQETYKPQIATDYYRRALSLISEQSLYTVSQLRLQEQLGILLHMQARFVEASQTYMTMRFAAMEDGDLVSQAQAWLGLAKIQKEQADYEQVLESANQAEQVAWLVNAETALARALMFKSEAYQKLGDFELAINAANRALELTERLAIPEEFIQSLANLTLINADLGQADKVTTLVKRIIDQISRLKTQSKHNQSKDIQLSIAFGRATLGRLYNRIGHYEQAAFQLLNALKAYREHDVLLSVADTLNILGETVILRGSYERAIPFFKEALDIAKITGNVLGTIAYRNNIGHALNHLKQYQNAFKELNKAKGTVQDVSKMVRWQHEVSLIMNLSEAQLGLGEVDEAIACAILALRKASERKDDIEFAVAWRTMGTAVSHHKDLNHQFEFRDRHYDATDSFAESLKLLKDSEDVATFREQVFTLWAWSEFELSRGNVARGESMQVDAKELADRLHIKI
ncbi:MAG: adenylate/guanylate cyclase domain-containing protein [Chloroflexota bacterium]